MTLTLISFGYLHLTDAVVPRADRVEDVRDWLRDPAADEVVLAQLARPRPGVPGSVTPGDRT